jgi:hypothetical protein
LTPGVDVSAVPTIDEKRVFDDRADARTLYLATSVGVVRVAVAADRVGEFGVARAGRARDVALAAGRLVVATDDDVAVDGEPTGLGRALAVGVDAAGGVLAVLADGSVRRPDGPSLGSVPDARAVDGGLVAAPDGVYRVTDDVTGVGLDDARDVCGAGGDGTPLAATGGGLYALGPGWTRRVEGAFDAVARGPGGAVALAADGTVWRADDGEWARLPAPPDGLDPVDVGRGPGATYVAGEAGELAARVDGGDWRTRALGTPGVARLVVGETKGERAGAESDRP